MIKLGDKVKDSITGFEGVVVARIEYLNGCIQFEVLPAGLKDGQPLKAHWIDEQRLTKTSKATAGGPGHHPPGLSRP